MESFTPPKIVFPHIMKTGGTTVANYLHDFFHEEQVLYEASTWAELNDVTFDRLQMVRFVRGHFFHAITDVFGPQNGYEIIGLLRHPVARVRSHYWHLMRAPEIAPAHKFVRNEELTFEQFVHSPKCRFFTANYQTRNYGCGLDFKVDATPDKQHLQLAKQFLDRCSVIGVTEDLDTFVESLAAHFGLPSTPTVLGKNRSYAGETEMSDELIDTIKNLNSLDMELYAYAQERIASQTIKAKPKLNPLAINQSGFMRWNVDEPFSGHGWSDLQRTKVRHRWSIANTSSLTIERNYSGRMAGFISLHRFVHDQQQSVLKVFLDDKQVDLKPVQFKYREGILYTFEVPKSSAGEMELRFEVETLMSFAEVNKNSNDKTERGLAITGVSFVPFG
ncbi:sulfotransferase family 2 domain-containing protein [Altererythrobacter lutimaris]|uniref:Sulfotransferase family 2 domain-containing protein n=1 Tax=Altererythrobacter lutimaris TaxID=2743979 RepID=A0A850HFF9_9SPHN|nr:sulfotransferase family 2 domain-containing protein [Altererythrobacter lutimaris]NVE95956.1 sulfotransferase family 2 domain-containing protein [Altererythrobacter lutimaris]